MQRPFHDGFPCLSRLWSFVSGCVARELPVFVMAVAVWGTEALRNYEGLLVWDADTSLWHYIARFSMTIVAAFCFTLCLQGKWARTFRRAVVYALVLLPAFLVYFIREHTGLELCATAWQMVLETNKTEASSFIHIYIWSTRGLLSIGFFLLLTLAVWLSDNWYHRYCLKSHPSWQRTSWFRLPINLSLIVGLCFSALYVWRLSAVVIAPNAQRWEAYARTPEPHDPVSKFALSLYSLRGMRAEIQQAVDNTRSFIEQDDPTVSADSLHVVLVVGESYIRSHAALYGYPLPTTPCMNRERDAQRLVVFQDAVTPVATTFQAMHEIFFAKNDSALHWYEGVFFPAVMRRAGYHVTYLDNQTLMETGATRSGQGYTVLNPMFHSDMVSMAYDRVGERNYDFDGQLVDVFLQSPSPQQLAFSILHLKGQHFDAKKMFPDASRHQVFKPTDYTFRKAPWLDDAMRQHIADYDNATLYNDGVLGKLFDDYRDKLAVIVYLSDHGEEVYDFRDQWGRQHREEDKRQVELLYRVPLVVWCSDRYRQTFPEITEALQQGASKPFITDDLPQLVFSLAQVQTSLYDAHRSPASTAYRPKPRVLLDGRDFDMVIGK